MAKHSFYVSLLITGAFSIWIALRVGPALWPYKLHIWHTYGLPIVIYLCLFILTLTLVLMLLARMIWLKDTGSKLQHAAKELQQGSMAKTPDSLLSLIQTRK